jgi:hypothetical protein
VLPRIWTGTPCCGSSLAVAARELGRTIDYRACRRCRHAWMLVLDVDERGWRLAANDLGSMRDWPQGLDLARLDTDGIERWLRLTPTGWLRPG